MEMQLHLALAVEPVGVLLFSTATRQNGAESKQARQAEASSEPGTFQAVPLQQRSSVSAGMSGIPTTALTGGAGGNPMDSPGTSPPPSTVTAPLGDSAGGGGGVAANEGEGGAPVPFPGEEEGEEDDEEEEDEEQAEDGEEGDADEDDNAKAGPSRPRPGSQGEGDASEAAETKTSGKGAGRGKGAAAKKVVASQPGTTPLPTARVKKIILSDPDVDSCGKEATFAIGKACVSELVERGTGWNLWNGSLWLCHR